MGFLLKVLIGAGIPLALLFWLASRAIDAAVLAS